MSNFDFSELGPDLILDAIESVGIYPESGLLPLNSYENRVYQFKADNGLRYVAKFYRPERWTEQQINEEHEFAFTLADAEIPVIAPCKIAQQALFEHSGYRFCLFPSVGGRMFEIDNLDQLEWLGRLLGRLHKVSHNQTFVHRETLNFELEALSAKAELEKTQVLPDYLRNTFFNDLDLLVNTMLEQVQHSKINNIQLHGDCHAGNILWQQDGDKAEALLVDLDDCINGPAVQDIWMMLSGDRQTKLLQLDTLLCGYEEFHEFDHSELALIEPLRARRMLNYMAWIAKRWQDPAFPRSFSWFATDKYWEQQVLAMKEQIAALQEPALKLLP